MSSSGLSNGPRERKGKNIFVTKFFMLFSRLRQLVLIETLLWSSTIPNKTKLAFFISRIRLIRSPVVSWGDAPLRSDSSLGCLLLPTYLQEIETLFSSIELSCTRPFRIIDIGANIGQFSLTAGAYLEMMGLNAEILTIEPNPQIADLLRENITNSKQRQMYLPTQVMAIGDERRIADLHFVDGKSSQASFDTDAALKNLLRLQATSVVSVKIQPLTHELLPDSWMGEEIDLIKIDVEGSEEAVLRGIRGVNAQNLWIETPFDDSGATDNSVNHLLKMNGFELVISDKTQTAVRCNGNILYRKRKVS